MKSLILLLVAILSGESAKILGIFHFHSRSHHILGSALLKALAENGHEVTMITPYALEKQVKNFEVIELTGILQYANNNKVNIMETQSMSNIERMAKVTSHIETVTEMVLNHESINKLLKSNRTFDLVIQNWFFNPSFLGIANHFNVPVIAFNTHTVTNSANRITGNPYPFSYTPYIFSSYSTNMTFFERVANTLIHLRSEFFDKIVFEPAQERLLHKYFPKAPPLQHLVDNISLILINSHFSIDNPRPYLPNMIPIGGFNLDKPGVLTAELGNFMDSATEGVLYFSLGSNLGMDDMSKKKLTAFIQSFEKLPLQVLWKCELENIPEIPLNVKIGRWFPQREILAHPNTKIFITHGGMLSMTEAIYYGVPIVGIPFFADQFSNIAEAVNNGYAVKLTYDDISEKTLITAVTEILTDSKYQQNIRVRSLALRDQPLKPMDNAIYWVEYILKHRGAPYLKSPASKLRWYQYFLVDVFIFFVGVAIVLLGLICICFKILLLFLERLVFGSVKSKNE